MSDTHHPATPEEIQETAEMLDRPESRNHYFAMGDAMYSLEMELRGQPTVSMDRLSVKVIDGKLSASLPLYCGCVAHITKRVRDEDEAPARWRDTAMCRLQPAHHKDPRESEVALREAQAREADEEARMDARLEHSLALAPGSWRCV